MSPRPNFQGVSPVILASSCDVLSNNSAIPDSGQLTYPFRKAIFIEEVSWVVKLAFASALNLGALVKAKMVLGQNYLMKDGVPIWVLGTEMSQLMEENLDSALTTPANYAAYRWRLPEPLYVEAGQVLSSVFSRGNDGFGSMNVQVAYKGRTVPPRHSRPSVIPIPYAAAWVSQLGNTYDASNEDEIANPFEKPLRVQRLTGRTLTLVSATTSAALKSLTLNPPLSGVNLRIADSWGGKIVNDPTGPADVFDAARGAWTVDTVMPAKGVYQVQASNIPSTTQVHVGMIGVREEEL